MKTPEGASNPCGSSFNSIPGIHTAAAQTLLGACVIAAATIEPEDVYSGRTPYFYKDRVAVTAVDLYERLDKEITERYGKGRKCQ
jgi:hypothetical protein